MNWNSKLCVVLLVLSVFVSTIKTVAQGPVTCPSNIGFEDGTFNNWDCYAGKVLSDGSLSLAPTAPIYDRHTIIKNTYPQAKDPYGNFPVNCPNGSNYSIRLGNSQTGAEAERVSYTFTIPANQNDYSIIYNYAVVIQNPNHADYQQPKFTSRVFDVTSNRYIDCGSFEFVASSNLPGFQLSAVGSNIYYKPWSPITINLYGYAGKTIRIEFTNNDCTLGGHFGYAYVDVNENCSSPISGNTYCNGANSVLLTAPFGFKEYHWFTSDFSQELGTNNVLKISPPPPPNTSYVLQIVPYPGLGCLDTLNTTIQLSPEAFDMHVKDSVDGCITTGVDITDKSITAGSSAGLTYSYFDDANGLNYEPTPKVVTSPGVYYIKGINSSGCTDIKPINVVIKDPPDLSIKNPDPVCAPATVDLTNAAIVAGNIDGLNYSYWNDSIATSAINNPKAINTNGTYYIRGSSATGCFKTVPVAVTIGNVPNVVINNPTGCGKVDLSLSAVTKGSDAGLAFSYWLDALASMPLPQPTALQTSGSFYVKGTTGLGCSTVKPVVATVNALPSFTVTSPVTVTYPATADLTVVSSPRTGLAYSYWKDQPATIALSRPNAVADNGTFYIQARTPQGCSLTQPVTVVINPPPAPTITAPNAFSPNNDGVNDLFKISVAGEVGVGHLRIFDRFGMVVFEATDLNKYWDGTLQGKQLPVGTYYWIFEGTDLYNTSKIVKSGSITLLR